MLMEPVERMIFFQGVDLFERGCMCGVNINVLLAVCLGTHHFSCEFDGVEGGFAIRRGEHGKLTCTELLNPWTDEMN